MVFCGSFGSRPSGTASITQVDRASIAGPQMVADSTPGIVCAFSTSCFANCTRGSRSAYRAERKSVRSVSRFFVSKPRSTSKLAAGNFSPTIPRPPAAPSPSPLPPPPEISRPCAAARQLPCASALAQRIPQIHLRLPLLRGPRQKVIRSATKRPSKPPASSDRLRNRTIEGKF